MVLIKRDGYYLIAMDLCMLLHISQSDKTLITDITFVRLFSWMKRLMPFQIAYLILNIRYENGNNIILYYVNQNWWEFFTE